MHNSQGCPNFWSKAESFTHDPQSMWRKAQDGGHCQDKDEGEPTPCCIAKGSRYIQ
jgi:hypothetical protein